MFGASRPQSSVFGNTGTSSLFANAQNQPQQQQAGGLFSNLGQTTQQPQQQSGGIFGSSTTQQQPSTGLFGSLGNTQPTQAQQQMGSIFGGSGLNTQQQHPQASLFGGQQNQQQQNAFGLGQSQQQPTSSLFGNTNTQGRSLFQNSSQQPLAQSQMLPQNSSIYLSGLGIKPREKSIPEQMDTVLQKWDTNNRNCVFRTYFYNKADDAVPFYHPGPQDDPKEWEEALSKKPGPGLVPTLCVGFLQMGERIKLQQNTLTAYNMRLHEINRSLSFLLENHDTKISIRAMDARRKHVALKQRCLALATKVQILRNKGFTMTGDEEVLKAKLMALDKDISDPGLGARAEEIWARMITVQERARLLRAEIERSGIEQTKVLDEETEAKAKKILEDYQTQLVHLKTELDKVQKDYEEWASSQPKTETPKMR